MGRSVRPAAAAAPPSAEADIACTMSARARCPGLLRNGLSLRRPYWDYRSPREELTFVRFSVFSALSPPGTYSRSVRLWKPCETFIIFAIECE